MLAQNLRKAGTLHTQRYLAHQAHGPATNSPLHNIHKRDVNKELLGPGALLKLMCPFTLTFTKKKGG